ncbi:hypothetical protein KBI33_02175 [Candidatus Shapirobacteria bacterium]|nr:hypothetical protein [Candidatus Shapirobacteria bacterium]
MPDAEPSPLPQELIGVPENDTALAEDLLRGIRRTYKECLAPILVSREKVNPVITGFEEKLHELNEKRANFYGRGYNPPEVFYVDHVGAMRRAKEINNTIIKMGLGFYEPFDRYGALYAPIGNFIIIFLNNFENEDIDGWYACGKLRHELSHAGSVTKHRVYQRGDSKPLYQEYRVGALLVQEGGNKLGLAAQEGHHAIEDEIFEGKHRGLLSQDEYLKRIYDLRPIFPGAQEKYEQLRQSLIQRGVIPQDRMLIFYRKYGYAIESMKVADSYEDYRDLMMLLYERRPELFRLFCDYTYGDKMINFAKGVEQTFGKGFFSKLMSVVDRESARKLINECSR